MEIYEKKTWEKGKIIGQPQKNGGLPSGKQPHDGTSPSVFGKIHDFYGHLQYWPLVNAQLAETGLHSYVSLDDIDIPQ